MSIDWLICILDNNCPCDNAVNSKMKYPRYFSVHWVKHLLGNILFINRFMLRDVKQTSLTASMFVFLPNNGVYFRIFLELNEHFVLQICTYDKGTYFSRVRHMSLQMRFHLLYS